MPRRPNRKSQARGAKSARRLGDGAKIPRPPQFEIEVKEQSKTFRFICQTAGGYTITRKMLCDLMQINVVAAGGANSYQTLIAAIRLRRLRMWQNPPSLGTTPVIMSMEWFGTNTPSLTQADVGNGIVPAHVQGNPPAESSCAWWSQTNLNGTDNMFAVAVGVGDTIDVVVDIVMVSTESPSTLFTDATGAGALGTTYGGYLDGYASKKLKPVGLTATP